MSLGGAVAAVVAEKREQVPTLVMEAPFTSVYDLAKGMYPFIPPFDVLPANRWRSIDRMSKIKAPVLVLHGARDRVIPVSHGHRISDAAQNARLITYPEGRHWNLGLLGAGEDVVGFLARDTTPKKEKTP